MVSDGSRRFSRLGAPAGQARTPAPRRTASSGSLPLTSSSGRPALQGVTGNHAVISAKTSSRRGEVPAARTQRDVATLLQLILDPSAQLLQPLAEFVAAYAKARYNPRTAERVALASQELVDNAMSYGSVSTSVEYTLYESDRTVEVRVINHSSPGRVSALQAQLERLMAGGAEQVYLQEMTRSMTGSVRVSLGLARVSHEGQMDIEFNLEGMRVTMCARCSR